MFKLLENIRLSLDKNGYSNFFINVRIDTYIRMDDPLEESIVRSRFYEQTGASGIFIPGLKNIPEIEKILGACRTLKYTGYILS
jgi:2-methylisocitrate lyase-like PEP mutase family enzyme